MSRSLRPRLPGVPFHITARIQWHKPHFAGAEPFVTRAIKDASLLSDAQIAAYAVMPNHFHLLVIHGSLPLQALMQPLLRRLALMVQRRIGKGGHVFEGPYFSAPCLDPEYLRNTIAYIHLNGARKALCTGAHDFEWCSHAMYCSAPVADPLCSTTTLAGNMLRMFARDDEQQLTECVNNYRQFLTWRLEVDRLRAAHPDAPPALPAPPSTLGGDTHWFVTFNTACCAAMERRQDIPHRPDLRDFAITTLQELAPDLPLAELRSGDSSRTLIRVRQAFIARALIAGYRGHRIARFLNLSDATVSRLKTIVRLKRSR
ncbi:MAG TPA: transposase [Longimicrobiales bacterium]|nr:transposase [Longimicrobiales bacterium]